MLRALLIFTWIPSALASIFASIFLLNYLQTVREANTLLRLQTEQFLPMNQIHFFAAVPQVLGTFSSTVATGDARPEILRTFLNRYNSPLAEHAYYMVEVADRYNVDYRLVTAIAMQESTGCKFIPDGSHNCWGYGIYGDKVLKFANYEEGIETVTRGIRENFIDQGLTTPEEIMTKYTPSSTSWAGGVEFFLEKMR